MAMPLFHVVTLGCKVNQCESASLTLQLNQAGYRLTTDAARADIFIINTCTVTSRAAMQSRQAVRRLLRLQPRARVLVTGCSVQTDPRAFQSISGVTHVVGHLEKESIPEILKGGKSPAAILKWPEVDRLPPLTHPLVDLKFSSTPDQGRTRAFFKIQDGCNSFCTYCIVPHARGRSRSLPLESVLAGLADYAARGYREVVLTGIHLGQWGRDLAPPSRIETLLDHIEKQHALEQIRLSSIEPNELSDGVIGRVAGGGGFARHFHIPLQSGDDGVLRRMGRPYTRAYFRQLIGRIQAALPDAGIGVDVMVGFPGEDPQAFEQTVSLLEALPVTYLHVFPFSPRPGTPAHDFDHQVPPRESKRRATRLRELGRSKQRRFLEGLVGRTVDVLVTGSSARDPQTMEGLTSNYATISFPGTPRLRNRRLRINVLELDGNHQLIGKRVA